MRKGGSREEAGEIKGRMRSVRGKEKRLLILSDEEEERSERRREGEREVKKER